MNFKKTIKSFVCCASIFLGVTNPVYAMMGPKIISQINKKYFDVEPNRGDWMYFYEKNVNKNIEKCTGCVRNLVYDNDFCCFIPYEKNVNPDEAFKNSQHYCGVCIIEKHVKPYLEELLNKGSIPKFDNIDEQELRSKIKEYVYSHPELPLPKEYIKDKILNDRVLNGKCPVCLEDYLIRPNEFFRVCKKNHFVHKTCSGNYYNFQLNSYRKFVGYEKKLKIKFDGLSEFIDNPQSLDDETFKKRCGLSPEELEEFIELYKYTKGKYPEEKCMTCRCQDLKLVSAKIINKSGIDICDICDVIFNIIMDNRNRKQKKCLIF